MINQNPSLLNKNEILNRKKLNYYLLNGFIHNLLDYNSDYVSQPQIIRNTEQQQFDLENVDLSSRITFINDSNSYYYNLYEIDLDGYIVDNTSNTEIGQDYKIFSFEDFYNTTFQEYYNVYEIDFENNKIYFSQPYDDQEVIYQITNSIYKLRLFLLPNQMESGNISITTEIKTDSGTGELLELLPPSSLYFVKYDEQTSKLLSYRLNINNFIQMDDGGELLKKIDLNTLLFEGVDYYSSILTTEQYDFLQNELFILDYEIDLLDTDDSKIIDYGNRNFTFTLDTTSSGQTIKELLNDEDLIVFGTQVPGIFQYLKESDYNVLVNGGYRVRIDQNNSNDDTDQDGKVFEISHNNPIPPLSDVNFDPNDGDISLFKINEQGRFESNIKDNTYIIYDGGQQNGRENYNEFTEDNTKLFQITSGKDQTQTNLKTDVDINLRENGTFNIFETLTDGQSENRDIIKLSTEPQTTTGQQKNRLTYNIQTEGLIEILNNSVNTIQDNRVLTISNSVVQNTSGDDINKQRVDIFGSLYVRDDIMVQGSTMNVNLETLNIGSNEIIINKQDVTEQNLEDYDYEIVNPNVQGVRLYFTTDPDTTDDFVPGTDDQLMYYYSDRYIQDRTSTGQIDQLNNSGNVEGLFMFGKESKIYSHDYQNIFNTPLENKYLKVDRYGNMESTGSVFNIIGNTNGSNGLSSLNTKINYLGEYDLFVNSNNNVSLDINSNRDQNNKKFRITHQYPGETNPSREYILFEINEDGNTIFNLKDEQTNGIDFIIKDELNSDTHQSEEFFKINSKHDGTDFTTDITLNQNYGKIQLKDDEFEIISNEKNISDVQFQMFYLNDKGQQNQNLLRNIYTIFDNQKEEDTTENILEIDNRVSDERPFRETSFKVWNNQNTFKLYNNLEQFQFLNPGDQIIINGYNGDMIYTIQSIEGVNELTLESEGQGNEINILEENQMIFSFRRGVYNSQTNQEMRYQGYIHVKGSDGTKFDRQYDSVPGNIGFEVDNNVKFNDTVFIKDPKDIRFTDEDRDLQEYILMQSMIYGEG